MAPADHRVLFLARVHRSTNGAVAVGIVLEVRLEDWFQHELGSGLYYPIPDGRDMGCIMHLVQLGFGDGKARRGEFATQSRSVRSVASVSVMAYGKPGFFRRAVTRPWSIQ